VDDVHVDWFGDEVEAITTTAGRRGLKLAMEHLLGVSTERVPIEEGTLMRSGKAGVDEAELIGMVTYSARNDRDNYDYAVRQHEDLTLRHADGRTRSSSKSRSSRKRTRWRGSWPSRSAPPTGSEGRR